MCVVFKNLFFYCRPNPEMTTESPLDELLTSLMSVDFDEDHFISETFLQHADTAPVIDQLIACEDRIQDIEMKKSRDIYKAVLKRREIVDRLEGELLAARETIAGLRAEAQKSQRLRIDPFRSVSESSKVLESAFACAALTRKAMKFATEAKKFRVLFPVDVNIETLSPETAEKMADGLANVLQDFEGLENVTALGVSEFVRQKKRLIGKFVADLHSAASDGNFQRIRQSVRGLSLLGERDREMDFFVQSMVADTTGEFSSKVKGGFLVDKVEKFSSILAKSAPAIVDGAVQVAMIDLAGLQEGLHQSKDDPRRLLFTELFWQKVASALVPVFAKVKKHATNGDMRRTGDLLKSISASAKVNVGKLVELVDTHGVEAAGLFSDEVLLACLT